MEPVAKHPDTRGTNAKYKALYFGRIQIQGLHPQRALHSAGHRGQRESAHTEVSEGMEWGPEYQHLLHECFQHEQYGTAAQLASSSVDIDGSPLASFPSGTAPMIGDAPMDEDELDMAFDAINENAHTAARALLDMPGAFAHTARCCKEGCLLSSLMTEQEDTLRYRPTTILRTAIGRGPVHLLMLPAPLPPHCIRHCHRRPRAHGGRGRRRTAPPWLALGRSRSATYPAVRGAPHTRAHPPAPPPPPPPRPPPPESLRRRPSTRRR